MLASYKTIKGAVELVVSVGEVFNERAVDREASSMKVKSVGSAIYESFVLHKSVGGNNESGCRSHCARVGTDAFIRHSGDYHGLHHNSVRMTVSSCLGMNFLDTFVIGVVGVKGKNNQRNV
jgi:hypothetical protein